MLNKKTELPSLLQFYITELLQKHLLPIRLPWHYISSGNKAFKENKARIQHHSAPLGCRHERKQMPSAVF